MRNTVLLALGFSAALVLGAAAATLDVKPGLWEVTAQGETSGMPPIPPQMLAQMTPQQREQAMAAMGRMNQPHVTRACVTQKMLDRGMTFDRPSNNQCAQTVTGSTSHSLDVKVVCTGEAQQKTTGTMHMDANGRESFFGAFNMVSTDGASTMTMKRTLQGKWLGSDCGDVKPHEE
jgi:hypothetical protein